MRWKWVFLAPLAVLGILLFAALGGEIVKLLWNWVLPPLFGWPPISFWQALGLLALCRILFGGRGFHASPGSRARRRLAERLRERWKDMTPEQRERLRETMRGHGGCGPSPGERGPAPSDPGV